VRNEEEKKKIDISPDYNELNFVWRTCDLDPRGRTWIRKTEETPLRRKDTIDRAENGGKETKGNLSDSKQW